jgi:purine-binding chemotaxis protein CheW
MEDNNTTEKKQTEQQTDSYGMKIIVFRTGNTEFGVNITDIQGIEQTPKITRIPNTKNIVKGAINIRGKIVVVVDLAKRLNLKQEELTKNSRILIINIENSLYGILVHSVSEVIRLTQEEIEEAPPLITKKINSKYIQGVGIKKERLIVLLNISKMITKDDLVD